MSKQILFSEDARKKLASGISQAAHAARVTLGPKGRNVILAKGFGGPRITNDGVSIVKEISLKDPFENVGADLVKDVANKTNDGAGDGTTTSIVLYDSMVSAGMKALGEGKNAMAIRRGMERAADDIVAALKKIAKPINGKADIELVASVSSESKDLGKTIAETIERVGNDGVVTVEESQGTETTFDVVDGMQTEKGYISPYMVTDEEKMEAEYKDVFVLVTDKQIMNPQDLVPVLEKVAQTGSRELVIVADDVGGEALPTLVVNKMRGNFSSLAIKTPGFGDFKAEQIRDLAIMLGATVVSDETGIELKDVTTEHLGKCARVVSSKDKTIFVGGSGKKAAVQERIKQIHADLAKSDSRFDIERLEKRIAKLGGGIAVIKVGAHTETAMKYLKDKIEDAVKATKASIEDGIIPGGGVALTKIAHELKANTEDVDEASGYSIVMSAMSAPFKQILANAGKENIQEITAWVLEKPKHGYNAASDEMVKDIVADGIIDPVKVTRNAVLNSTSAAAIFLTTEAAVVELPEPKPQAGTMDF